MHFRTWTPGARFMNLFQPHDPHAGAITLGLASQQTDAGMLRAAQSARRRLHVRGRHIPRRPILNLRQTLIGNPGGLNKLQFSHG